MNIVYMNEEQKEKIRAYKREYYKKNRDKIIKNTYKNKMLNTEKYANTRKKYYEKLRKPTVYKYIEIDTNKLAYIGSTINIYKRVCNRKTKNGENGIFGKIYLENPENYKLEIIKEFDTIEEAREYEKTLIKALKPLYNIVYNKLF